MTPFPVYIINLRSSVDRWDNVSKAFDAVGVPYLRFEAVDGYDLTCEQSRRYTGGNDNYKWLRALSSPEIGCYLSHLQLWEKVSNSPCGGAFIFEDDVTLLPGLTDVLEILSRADDDGRPLLVKLGDDVRQSRWIIGRRALGGGYTLVSHYHIPWGTGAYYINRRAAARLAEKRRTFFRTVDDDLHYHWETGVNVEMVSPPVIQHPAPDTNSGIKVSRDAVRQLRRRVWKGRLMTKLWQEHFTVLNAAHTPRRILSLLRGSADAG